MLFSPSLLSSSFSLPLNELYASNEETYIYFTLCVLGFACSYVGAPHMCSAPSGQEGALAPLDLELQIFVSSHVGAHN